MNSPEMNMFFNRNLFLCLLISWTYSAPEPQPQSKTRTSYFRGQEFYSGAHIETWSVADIRASQIALPLMYSVDLANVTPGLAVDVVTSPMWAFINGDTLKVLDSNSVFGLTGTKTRVSYNYHDLVLGTFGIRVPTGDNNLTFNQASTSGAVSTRQMHFKVGQIGGGWDVNMTAASAHEIADDFVVGASISILTKGPFTPIKNPFGPSTTYNPGNEISIAGGLDYIIYVSDRKIKLLSDLVYSYYTWDYNGTRNSFKAGSMLKLNVMGGTKINEQFYNSSNLTVVLKRDDIVDLGYDDLNGDKVIEYKGAGTDFLLSDYLHYLPDKKYNPYGIVRVYSFTGREGGNGSLGYTLTLGAGAGGKMRLKNNLSLTARAIIDMGGMGGKFLWGTEISGGARMSF